MAGGNENKKTKGTSASWYHVKLTFFISLLSYPETYFLNSAFETIDETVRPLWMMVGGTIALVSTIIVTAVLSRSKDWFYYGLVLFSFTCVIDLIITLEFNGLISGFMSEYLKLGEPYLSCPFGSAIALFDGIGFYAMYFIMVHLFTNGKSWRSTGIYWGAGILNSMAVLMLGVFTGKHSPTLCTFFNVPYVFFPIAVLFRAFGTERRSDWNQTVKSSSLMKIFDLVLALGFIASICICLAKGLGALGCEGEIVLQILKHEPALYLDNPAPYSIIQALIYIFYFVPIQCISLFYTLRSHKPQFLWEMTLVHAGAMLQAQFSFIVHSLDPQIPDGYMSNWTDGTFWLINLLIVVVPHLYLFQLSQHSVVSNKMNAKKQS